MAWLRIKMTREHMPRCARTSGSRRGKDRVEAGGEMGGGGRKAETAWGFPERTGTPAVLLQLWHTTATRKPARGRGGGGLAGGTGTSPPPPPPVVNGHCVWLPAWTPLRPGPWFSCSSQNFPLDSKQWSRPGSGADARMAAAGGGRGRERGRAGRGAREKASHPWARLGLRPASPSGPQGCT